MDSYFYYGRMTMNNNKNSKLFFWSVILICLLVSAGQIPKSTAANDPAKLVINELLATNGTGLTDEDGEYSDWIELYNRSDTAINLAGWALTDDPNEPQKWPFPDITLNSHDYLVVFASGKDRRATVSALHTNFKLDREGDFLALYNVLEDRVMDGFAPKFPEQFKDIAYGRYGAELTYGYLAQPTPGGANDETASWAGAVAPVQFSVERGFFEKPFVVSLTCATPGAVIRYTIDGSEPTELNGLTYEQPIPVSATTLLRAAAFKSTFLPAEVVTQSYIFLNDVLNQPAVPAGFPANWGAHLSTDATGQTAVLPVSADYEMDPAVVADPGYADSFKDNLTSLPTLSLVMAGQSFADFHTRTPAATPDLERPVSVEFIFPNGDQPNFQANAGLELQGELESAASDPKHSFRLLFKRQFGPTKLEFPVFAESPVDEFDTLVLQAGALSDPTAFSRDVWLHNSQIAMSGLGANSAFVHLYLNGLYWGLYEIVERPSASFMASYLGGEKEDWFVTNQAGPLDVDPALAQDRLNYLFTTLNFAGQFNSADQSLASTYAEVASFFDFDQFSDFMILNWYTQRLGWPENRWHAAVNRQDLVGRGKFLIWNEPDGSQPTGISMRTGETTTTANLVNPLFQTLLENPDLRLRLADRIYKHLANGGALSDTAIQARWQAVNRTISQAIVAESARWGDANPASPLTPAAWQAANDTALAQLKGQNAQFLTWARETGYYPPLDPPYFSQEGGVVESGFRLTMNLPAVSANGTIYYTLDGSDPRLPVTGEIGPTAQAYTGPVALTANTVVKARVLQDGSEFGWSALHEAAFNVIQQGQRLRITEIMYNPTQGDDFEFIELKNMGNNAVDLANVSIDEGIYYRFPPNTPPLAPGQVMVLVSNAASFAEQYPGVPVGGVYDGHLSNKGEMLLMTDAEGEPLVELTYDDAYGWPVSADGRGDSLVLVQPDGDPDNPQNWRASTYVNGSPGSDEPLAGEKAAIEVN